MDSIIKQMSDDINEHARIIYEERKKIRDEKRALSEKHERDCEYMLMEILKEDNNLNELSKTQTDQLT